MSIESVIAEFAEWWTPQTSTLVAGIVIGSLLTWWRFPASRGTVRNTLLLMLISFVALMLLRAFETPQPTEALKLSHGALTLVIGAMIIRLAGLVLFQVILATLHVHPPSILEEILVVIAWFAWVMLQASAAGASFGEVLTTSAIATAVLAFALQDTLGNVLGGLALQWDHSLQIGDWIRVDDVEGKIVDIKWRAVSLETRNWETVVIPNSIMMRNQFLVLGERQGEARRWRRWVWFCVDYSTPPDKVIAWVEDTIRIAEIPCVEDSPAPSCVFMEMDGSVGRYALRYWLSDFALDDPTDSLVRQHIYAALNRHAVRIAMPKQHLYLTDKDDSYAERKQSEELDRRRRALGEIDLFAQLETDKLEQLAEKLEYRPYAEGDVVFSEGDEDHFLYVIVEGQAAEYTGSSTTPALSLGQGSVFGVHGFMTGDPRSATVRAESEVKCYALGSTTVRDVLLNREDVVEEISVILAAHQAARDNAHAAAGKEGATDDAHAILSRIRQFMGLARSEEP